MTDTTDIETPEEAEALIERCKALAPGFAERADESDRNAAFPEKNFQELKDAGLMGVMVPKSHGGMGATFRTYTKAIEQLAKGDAATALAYNMHNIAVGSLSEVSLEGIGGSMAKRMTAFRDWVFEESVKGKVFASASSEPGLGAHFSKFQTRYRRVDGGFTVSGEKSFVSIAGHADYYVVAARSEDLEGSDVTPLSYLVVEADNPDIEFQFIWDTLGMRSTSTNPMKIKDAFVPKDRLFGGSEGLALYKIIKEPHWLVGGYNGVYLGIASLAFDTMVEMLKKKRIPGTDRPLTEDTRVQYSVGQLASRLRAARLVTDNAAMLVDTERGTPEANEAIHHAKLVCSELAPWLSSQAIRLCGASAIARRLPLERAYRDARCGGLMPATSDDCLMYLGKSALGADMSDPTENLW
ncbi:MAG: acyl-CoA/acyl-ACP dehydrogenase [Myxococcales bacterium]|nr:acyl-CoA/acyl-ACP dehydrogenase [Myxococcales bacterium]